MVYAIILLLLWVLGLGYAMAKHGEQIECNYNFWATLISRLIWLWLLYMADFFDVFKQ